MTSQRSAGRPRAGDGPAAAEPGASDSAAAKQELRARITHWRRGHPIPAPDAARRTETAIAASVGHAVVACYASLPDEPDTWALLDALSREGVAVLLPRLRREPDWAWYRGRSGMHAGWRGIPQPEGPLLGASALSQASLIWVSGLAGTPRGDRLGTGGGWYDRALTWAAPEAEVAMLLNEREVVADLPVDPWDLPIDRIVTEAGTLVCGRE